MFMHGGHMLLLKSDQRTGINMILHTGFLKMDNRSVSHREETTGQ